MPRPIASMSTDFVFLSAFNKAFHIKSFLFILSGLAAVVLVCAFLSIAFCSYSVGLQYHVKSSEHEQHPNHSNLAGLYQSTN